MTKDNLVLLTIRLYRLTLLFPKKEPLRCKLRECADDILASGIKRGKEINGSTLAENLDTLDGYLKVAMDQNWVAGAAILEIQQEYAKMNQDLNSQEKPRAENAGEFKVREKAEEFERNAHESETNRSAERKPGETRPPAPVTSAVPLITASKPVQTFAGIPEADENGGEDQGPLTEGQIKRQQRIVEYLKEKGQAQVWEIQKIFPDISKRTIRRDFRNLLKQEMIERVGERNKTYYKMKVILS